MRRVKSTAVRLQGPRRTRRQPRWLRRMIMVCSTSAIVAAGAGVLWITIGQSHILPAVAQARALWSSEAAEAGLTVQKVSSDGRVRTSVDELRTVLDGLRGLNILSVDIEQTRRRIEELPWVQAATIHRRLPDTIHVSLQERKPLVLAETDEGGLALIDEVGDPIRITDLRPYAKLPTVGGKGAERHARELVALITSEPELARRVTGAHRVGDRRWNVWIDDRVEVRLPEADATAAWHRLAQAEATRGLLDKSIAAVELRVTDGIIVQPLPRAAADGREGA